MRSVTVFWLAVAAFSTSMAGSPVHAQSPAMMDRMATAGMRDGMRRTAAQSRALYRTLPAGTTVGALSDLDGSHIVPYSKGGSFSAGNIVFESASKNRARGAVAMTAGEVRAARAALYGRVFLEKVKACFAGALVGGAAALGAEVVAAALDHSLTHAQVGAPESGFLGAVANAMNEHGMSSALVGSAVTCALPVLASVTGVSSIAAAVAVGAVVTGVAILSLRLYSHLVDWLGYAPLAIAWGYVKEAMLWLDLQVRSWVLPEVTELQEVLVSLDPLLASDTFKCEWFGWLMPLLGVSCSDVEGYERRYRTKTLTRPMTWSEWWASD